MTAIPRRGSVEKLVPHTRLDDDNMVEESYEIISKLGEGSFGKVFQVRHKATNEQWAMKSVNKDKAGTSAIKLLEREVAILKRVLHPNIIKLNEVLETPMKMYMVMELCEGGELADILKSRKFFTENEVKVITKDLASAIAYLHKHDIVHRDLKLENILLSKVPDASHPETKLQIRITDFGLSVTKSGVGHDNMMQDFCGTPNYMAPEIIDNKTYSQQCDVWALGVIVYSLFCGNPPFQSGDQEKLYELIKKGDIDFKSLVVWKNISEGAKDCICSMMRKDPAYRLTASEVLYHSWLTGQDGKSTNVLQLMKEWKDDLKNPVAGDENETVVFDDASAINGELEQVVINVETSEDHASKESNNNEIEMATETSDGGKDSGGTKKTGSGERKHSGCHTLSPPKMQGSPMKPASIKVPSPKILVAGSSRMSIPVHPVGQNSVRSGTNDNKQPASMHKALTSGATTKENAAKK